MSDEQSAMTPWEVGRTLVRIEAAQLELTREVRARHHEIANKVNDAIAPISGLRARVDSFERAMENLKRDNEKMEGRIESLTSVITSMGKKVDGMWNRAIGAGLVLGLVGWIVTQAFAFLSGHR